MADAAMVVAAFILDALLLNNMLVTEPGYVRAVSDINGSGLIILWLALWAGWQPLAIVNIFRRSRAQL